MRRRRPAGSCDGRAGGRSLSMAHLRVTRSTASRFDSPARSIGRCATFWRSATKAGYTSLIVSTPPPALAAMGWRAIHRVTRGWSPRTISSDRAVGCPDQSVYARLLCTRRTRIRRRLRTSAASMSGVSREIEWLRLNRGGRPRPNRSASRSPAGSTAAPLSARLSLHDDALGLSPSRLKASSSTSARVGSRPQGARFCPTGCRVPRGDRPRRPA